MIMTSYHNVNNNVNSCYSSGEIEFLRTLILEVQGGKWVEAHDGAEYDSMHCLVETILSSAVLRRIAIIHINEWFDLDVDPQSEDMDLLVQLRERLYDPPVLGSIIGDMMEGREVHVAEKRKIARSLLPLLRDEAFVDRLSVSSGTPAGVAEALVVLDDTGELDWSIAPVSCSTSPPDCGFESEGERGATDEISQTT